MHPLLELLLNPMAGDDGNLIAIMFYIGLVLLAIVWLVERSFTNKGGNLLKSHGFKWSPLNMAWQRLLNSNCIYAFNHRILPALKAEAVAA